MLICGIISLILYLTT